MLCVLLFWQKSTGNQRKFSCKNIHHIHIHYCLPIWSSLDPVFNMGCHTLHVHFTPYCIEVDIGTVVKVLAPYQRFDLKHLESPEVGLHWCWNEWCLFVGNLLPAKPPLYLVLTSVLRAHNYVCIFCHTLGHNKMCTAWKSPFRCYQHFFSRKDTSATISTCPYFMRDSKMNVELPHLLFIECCPGRHLHLTTHQWCNSF